MYSTWISTLFPQQKRSAGGKGAKRASGASKKTVDAADQVGGADGPAVTTAYDESWIPEHHMKRPESRRVKSGGTPGKKGRVGKAE